MEAQRTVADGAASDSGSSANEYGSGNGQGDNPGVLIPPPVFLVFWIGVGLLVREFYPGRFLPPAVAGWGGAISLTVVISAIFGCFFQFRRHRTNLLPSRPDRTLIRGGLYRFSRNPLYVLVVLSHVATAVSCNSWTLMVFALPLFLTLSCYVVPREEKYLAERFGSEYKQYCQEVRRWV